MVTIIECPDPPNRPDPPRDPNPWPLLKPGTMVKAQTYGFRFHWLPVTKDDGPENDRERRVYIQAQTHQFYVRRKNVIVLEEHQKQTAVSEFDTVHNELLPVAEGKAKA
jgi:hypothetical protein